MKRFSLFILLLTCLVALSCNKEPQAGLKSDGEATMSLKLEIPQAIQTKSFGDGSYDSKNVIIAVFNSEGQELTDLRAVREWSATTLSEEVQFKLLIGNTYSIVSWAQYGDTYGDPQTMPLDEIVFDYEGLKSNEEERDAFFANIGPFKVNGDFDKSMVLKRPFAQINFATTPGDIEAARIAGLNVLQTSVVIKDAATKLNLFTGKASDPEEVRVQRTDFASQTIEVDEETYDLLAMNYILVNDGSSDGNSRSTVDLTLEVGGVEHEIPNAYVCRNHRTNVVGTILTGTGNFKVSIGPSFDGYFDYDADGELDDSGSTDPGEGDDDPDEGDEDPVTGAPEEYVQMPYKESFASDQGQFTIDDVSVPDGLTAVWSWDAQYGMKATAYANGSKLASESWVLSPWIDLTDATSAYLSYDHAGNYFSAISEEVGVMIMPYGGEWEELGVETWPSNWTYVSTGDIDLSSYAGKYVQIGIMYTSDTESAGTYEFKNFRVAATPTPYLSVSSERITVEADAVSAEFTVDSNCEWSVASDNSAFTASASGSKVSVSFAANTSSESRSAKISVSGVEGLSAVVTITQKGVSSGEGGEYSKIEEISALSAGTYYMAGFLESYTYDGNTLDWSANPYHLCTGAGTDIYTSPYAFAEGKLTQKDGESYEAIDVVLEAVSDKANVYYIKIDGQYLYSTSYANRKLAVGDTAVEWVASDNENGGITMTTTLDEGTISMGTAGATSRIIRSYKSDSTLKYGLVFFKKN